MVIFDPNKPTTSTKFVSADIRDNFNALSRANDLRSSAQDVPDLTVVVQSGRFQFNSIESHLFAGGNSPTLDTTSGGTIGQERIAILQIDVSSVLSWKYGNWATAGSATSPNFDGNKITVSQVIITHDMTEITETELSDIRPFVNLSAGGISPILLTVAATDVLGPTLGQVAFDTSSLFSYTVGMSELLIYIDGVYQTEGIDYVETDEYTITFNAAVDAGSRVTIWKVGLAAQPGNLNFSDLDDISTNESAAFNAADVPTAINPFLTVSGHSNIDHSAIVPILTMLTDITTLQGHVTSVAGAHAASAISVVDNLTFASPTTVQEAVDSMQVLRDDFLNEHTIAGVHGPKVTIIQTDADSALTIDKTNTDAGVAVVISNSGTGKAVTIDHNGTSDLLTTTHSGLGGISFVINHDNVANASIAMTVVNSGLSNAMKITQVSASLPALHIDSCDASILIDNSSGTGNALQINQSGIGKGLSITQAGANVATLFNKTNVDSSNVIEISNSGTGKDIRGNSNNWDVDGLGNARLTSLAFNTGSSVGFRMVWGAISLAGGILDPGSGDWGPSKSGLGDYSISFAPPFSSPPIVQFTPIAPIAMDVQLQVPTIPGTASIFTFNAGILTDTDFHFIAIGSV